MKVTLIAFAVLLAPTAHAQEYSVDDLKRMHADWKEQVEFRSSYTLKTGSAASFADAFDGTPFAEVESEAVGLFNKRDDLLRVSIDYGQTTAADAIVDLQSGEQSPARTDQFGNEIVPAGHGLLISQASEDEVTQGDRWLCYRPRWKNSNDVVVLQQISGSSGRQTSTAQMRISPLNPFPGFQPDPFSGEAAVGGTPGFEIVSPNDGILVVKMTSAATIDGTAYEQTETIELWTEPKLPVVRRIHRRITYRDGQPFLEREARLSEFVQIGDLQVARRVVLATQTRKVGVHVQEWLSDDLGAEPPADADFEIIIPASTRVLGVLNPPPPGQERTLDIRELQES